MLRALKARLQQKYRTTDFPNKPPNLPEKFRGFPIIQSNSCNQDCKSCIDICPVDAIKKPKANGIALDLGECLFCGHCERVCEKKTIGFSREYRLATSNRDDLVIKNNDEWKPCVKLSEEIAKTFGRSLKLRQVSAGGCNACELDLNVLGTVVYDIGRFGIQFVASPRHADGIVVTGPVTENMRLALQKTYDAIPSPKLVICVGACAIGGGPFKDHPEVHNGVRDLLPIDLFIPGCPPHPATILDGLLRFLGRIK